VGAESGRDVELGGRSIAEEFTVAESGERSTVHHHRWRHSLQQTPHLFPLARIHSMPLHLHSVGLLLMFALGGVALILTVGAPNLLLGEPNLIASTPSLEVILVVVLLLVVGTEGC
jgi:hypothetical protein